MNANLSDPAFWSRFQFGLTLIYHYLFPQLTTGLALFLVYWKWRALRTGDESLPIQLSSELVDGDGWSGQHQGASVLGGKRAFMLLFLKAVARHGHQNDLGMGGAYRNANGVAAGC